jgi:hypothetical protein
MLGLLGNPDRMDRRKAQLISQLIVQLISQLEGARGKLG